MRESLKELRQRQYVGVTELAAAAARLIDVYVPAQERGTVSEVPDERMVRYYLTEGLLSPAIGRQGTASLYGWLHLLQLVMIKRLQADHLPIRKIRELLDGRSEKELEAWLGIEEKRASGRIRNDALDYLESLLPPPARVEPNRSKQSPVSYSALPPPRPMWTRLEVEPGLEIHLQMDYQLPDETSARQALARRIINLIEAVLPKAGK
ncbi:MAG: MerR family transcriptional regulator [Blastocatellia bacterium]